MRLAAAIVAVTVAVDSVPSSALAWGYEGHRIAAEIAEYYLKPETARQVRVLLALDNATTLAQVSTWADDIRPQRPETGRWRYVDIPIHPPAGTPAGYDAARDCPRGDCVVAKIDEFSAVLRNSSAPPEKRLEALKFLVHFVADIHQPLHCADNGDRRGKDVSVVWHRHLTTLYGLWDTGILAAADVGDERSYASALARSITAADAAAWRGGTATDWANESYDLARQLIYGEWPHSSGALPGDYATTALPVVNMQLEKAGVRLASVLNATLGP